MGIGVGVAVMAGAALGVLSSDGGEAPSCP